jgi:hypothetical protein
MTLPMPLVIRLVTCVRIPRQLPLAVTRRSIMSRDGCAWLPGFTLPGLDGDVLALAVYDDGTGPALYAGGPDAGDDLEEGGGCLGDPFNDAQREGAGAEFGREEDREQGIDHLAGDVGEETGDPEDHDGAGDVSHVSHAHGPGLLG